MKCMRVDCKRDATKQIKFHLLPKEGDAKGTAEVNVIVCNEHATQEAANELLVDNIPGRRFIEDKFEKEGLDRPDWTRSYAEWVDI